MKLTFSIYALSASQTCHIEGLEVKNFALQSLERSRHPYGCLLYFLFGSLSSLPHSFAHKSTHTLS